MTSSGTEWSVGAMLTYRKEQHEGLAFRIILLQALQSAALGSGDEHQHFVSVPEQRQQSSLGSTDATLAHILDLLEFTVVHSHGMQSLYCANASGSWLLTPQTLGPLLQEEQGLALRNALSCFSLGAGSGESQGRDIPGPGDFKGFNKGPSLGPFLLLLNEETEVLSSYHFFQP